MFNHSVFIAGLCLSNENAWKDWDDETCKYYAKTTGACDGYNQFAAKYPGYPKENPCCACKGKINILCA